MTPEPRDFNHVVRTSEEERAALHTLAAVRGVPCSYIIREHIEALFAGTASLELPLVPPSKRTTQISLPFSAASTAFCRADVEAYARSKGVTSSDVYRSCIYQPGSELYVSPSQVLLREAQVLQDRAEVLLRQAADLRARARS